MRIVFLGILISLIVLSCVPPTENVETDVNVSLRSPSMQRLLDYQDKGASDSLFAYFHSLSPAMRYHAVLAFASIQDKTVLDSLNFMLEDQVMEVKSGAAYALGQIGDPRAEKWLISAFKSKDTLDINNEFNSLVLESVGKTGSKKTAKMLASVKTYRKTDNFLLLGQMKALYRFGLRGIVVEEGTNAAINYVLDVEYPENVRILAANYMARFSDANPGSQVSQLTSVLEKDKNPYVRMALVTCIGRSALPEIGDRLRALLRTEQDYRVKCNIIRALSNFGYISNIEMILNYLNDKNQHIAKCAADFLVNNGYKDDTYIYKQYIHKNMFWDVRAGVYKAILKHTPLFYTKIKNQTRDEISKLISGSQNEYEKADLIRALGEDPYQYQYIINLATNSNLPVVKTAIAEALTALISNPQFVKAYGTNQYKVKKVIVDFLINQCRTGDTGIVATTAAAFKNSKGTIPIDMLMDSTWIPETLLKLKLPRDVEAYQEMKACEAYITSKPYTQATPSFNHPIEWSTLATINDSTVAVIKTNKGNIRIKLFTSDAPGSVINFVQLCSSDFYDGKIFHRVVPNFVVQTGCPRGDGYGGLDYTLRSELPPLYYDTEGYVGMASAGKDTEGTQFFITHSPTPHLDGKYTIFGKVTEGMDVVHELQVGDKIIDAIITKY